MKAVRIALPFMLLGVVITAAGQEKPAASVDAPKPRVIVPWTYFGQAPPAPAQPNAPPQPASPYSPAIKSEAAQSSRPSQPEQGLSTDPGNETQPAPPDLAGAPASSSDAEAVSKPADPTLYEADISQKHAHPPWPVDLPLADRNAAPLSKVIPAGGSEGQLTPASPGAGGMAPNASAAPSDSPEAQIAALTAGYRQREAGRESQRSALENAGAKDPSTLALARVEETRLLLEGEKDRGATSQQLAKAFASLGEKLEARAQRIHALVESRNQTAVSAEAELNLLNGLAPRRELALRNLAMLPPSTQSDQMMSGLNTELAQQQATHKLDQQRSLEARGEMKALKAEAGQLQQAAAEARQKSSDFANATRAAQVNESLLADRLEYFVARMRATDVLSSAAQALDHSAVLKDNVQLKSPASPAVTPAPTARAPQSVDRLRDCIRRTGNLDACRGKGSL